jgi:hypothetical protein
VVLVSGQHRILHRWQYGAADVVGELLLCGAGPPCRVRHVGLRRRDTVDVFSSRPLFWGRSSSAAVIKDGPDLVNAPTPHTDIIDLSQSPAFTNFANCGSFICSFLGKVSASGGIDDDPEKRGITAMALRVPCPDVSFPRLGGIPAKPRLGRKEPTEHMLQRGAAIAPDQAESDDG